MSSDAAPAAVPGPQDPASIPGEEPRGLLESMLSTTPPARPATFNLDPAATSPEASSDVVIEGASSAAHHLGGTSPQGDGKGNSSSTRQETGIIRAWLLAGAERWRKGGEARIKRIEMEKARAQAHQSKTNRQVTVNRSGGLLGTGPGMSGNSKSSNNKTASGTQKDPKNWPGKSVNGTSTGTSGRHGTGTIGDSKTRNGSGTSNSTNTPKSSSSDKPKTHKDDKKSHAKDSSTGTKAAKAPKDGGDGKAGAQGAAGKPGKDAPKNHGTSGNSDKNGSHSKTGDKHGKAATGDDRVTLGKAIRSEVEDRAQARLDARRANPDTPVISRRKDTTPKQDGKDTQKEPDKEKGNIDPKKTDGDGKGRVTLGQAIAAEAQDRLTARRANLTPAVIRHPPNGKDTDAATGDKKVNLKKDNKAKTADDDTNGSDAAKTKDTDRKGWTLRDSREAGYRDGARAGHAVAHVKAYRDGVKDGWTDSSEAAARGKDRLDQARADRKQERTEDMDKPVPGQPSSADHHQPKPISVTGADASGIHLGEGAIRSSMNRGEVRSFAGFQKRFEDRSAVMAKRAERSKAYEAHAGAQTAKCSRLLEQAKGVEGGEKLIDTLTRWIETSRLQEIAAREVHKRAVRGAEGCNVLIANADTRYGDIVRAAADSADDIAELKYYRDLGVTNA